MIIVHRIPHMDEEYDADEDISDQLAIGEQENPSDQLAMSSSITDIVVAKARLSHKKRYGEHPANDPATTAANIAVDALMLAAEYMGRMSPRELVKLAGEAASVAEKLRRLNATLNNNDKTTEVAEAIKNALKSMGITRVKTLSKHVRTEN